MGAVVQIDDHLEWCGYIVRFCDSCGCLTIGCHDPECMGAYCNGGSCQKCHQDFADFGLIEREAYARWVYDPDRQME